MAPGRLCFSVLLCVLLAAAACGGGDSDTANSFILSPEGYKLKIETIAEAQALQLNVFAHLMERLDFDGMALGDATWRADVAASIKRLRAYETEFRSISPPPCAK